MSVESLVAAIHGAPVKLVLATTGGGSQAIADLLTVPGGSRTVLEAIVPYADRAVNDWLHATPEHYCCESTARLLAMASYLRARQLAPADAAATDRLIGVGATASLASSRPKRGPHRLYVAVQTATETNSVGVEFRKDARTRREEERLAADIILNVLAEAAGVAARLEPAWLQGETPVAARMRAPEAWQELLAGRQCVVPARPPWESTVEQRTGRLVMPGAFHPRHDGHRRMAKVAQALLGQPVHYELSIWNVDKPPLDYVEIAGRLHDFATDEPVWLTRAPTFVEKSRLFPRATFVVGADTITRIAQPKYYGDDERARDAALEALAQAGCRFLVFGRLLNDRFQTLDELALPAVLRAICQGCDEPTFRCDLSSTEVRRQSDHS